MKPRTAKVVLASVSGLACLIGLEIAVRVMDVARGVSVRARTSWYWLYEQDPYLGYRGRTRMTLRSPEDVITHDAEGFRDDRDLADVAGTGGRKLVICVGESSTYGISAGQNRDTYPASLERRLRALSGDDSWVVFNAGMPGYTSYEIAALLDLRLLKTKPLAVVSMNLRNDHEFVVRYLDDRQDYDFYPLRVAQLSATFPNEILMRSSLYGFFASRLRRRFVDDLGGAEPAPLHDRPTERGLAFYRSHLAQASALCDLAGARLMFVDQPVNDRVASYDDAKRASLGVMRGELHAFCAERGVPLLKAQDGFRWDDLPPDDVHLGRIGYDRLAETLAPQILAALGGRLTDPAAPAPSSPPADAATPR